MEIISNNLKIFEGKNYDSLIEKISSQDYILPSVQEYISILHSLKDNFYNDWFKYDPLIRNLTGFFVTSTKTLVKSNSLLVENCEIPFPFYMELSSPWKNSKKHILINSVFNTSQIKKIGGLVKKLSIDKVDISPSSISCIDLKGISAQTMLNIDFLCGYLGFDFSSYASTIENPNCEIKCLAYKSN